MIFKRAKKSALSEVGYIELSSYRRLFNILDEILGALVLPSSSILDVGCGKKTHLLTHCNFHITGCDLDHEAIKQNKEIQDYKVCTAEELLFESSQFELIMSFNVIEHIKNPEDFVGRAYDVLKPEGYFVGVMPNLNSIFGLIACYAPLSLLRLGSKILMGSATENHVHWYRMNTSDDCKQIVLNSGFELISITFINQLPSSRPLKYILFPYYQLCKFKWARKYSTSLLCVGRKLT